MIFIEILQLNCYAVPELPPSRNRLHNCIYYLDLSVLLGFVDMSSQIGCKRRKQYTQKL